MKSEPNDRFKQNYEAHRKHLRLKGLQPATIRAYSRAIEHVGAYFGYQIDALTPEQLTDYFTDRLKSHSWSAVKHDLSVHHVLLRVLGKSRPRNMTTNSGDETSFISVQ